MLRKCLKYEFRASVWLMPFLALAAALLYGAGWAAKAIGIEQMSNTFAVVLILVGVAGMVVALIMAITRYYKGLFGAEGYLNQTLPVKKGMLLASRLIVAFVLLIVGFVLLFASLFGMLHLMDTLEYVTDIFQQLGSLGGQMLAYIIALGFIQLLLFVVEVFFAITLANTRRFLSNNLPFSIVFYFAIQFLVGLLEMAGLLFLPVGVRIGADGLTPVPEGMLHTILQIGPEGEELSDLTGQIFGLGSGIVDVIALVGLIWLTVWLLKKKTSVK